MQTQREADAMKGLITLPGVSPEGGIPVYVAAYTSTSSRVPKVVPCLQDKDIANLNRILGNSQNKNDHMLVF